MHTFSSSTVSLPAGAGKKSKRNILRRLSLGKPKASSSSSTLESISSLTDLGSRSTATLAVASDEEYSGRRAFDLFSSSDVPPVPEIPEAFLMTDKVYVISAPPKSPAASIIAVASPAATVVASRLSDASNYSIESGQTFDSSKLTSLSCSASNRSSASWLDSLGSASSEELPIFAKICHEQLEVAPESMRSRSSLDEIDEELLANLSQVSVFHKLAPSSVSMRITRSEVGHGTVQRPRGHARSCSQHNVPPVPAIPALYKQSHARTGSAPHSLGPLPAPPEAPSAQVLRRTEQIKKRCSRQASSSSSSSSSSSLSSPLITNSSQFDSSSTDEMAFTTRRATPSTPKLNSVSSLLLIEADLSLDSKVYKRNHRRTVSKDYASKSFDVMTFTPPREIKLTPGHIATPQNEQESEFVSRFSDDSDSDTSHDDPARLFGIFPLILGGRMDSKSPKMNQLSDFSSYYTITTNGDGDNNTTSSSTLSGSSSRCDSSITGTQTPNMIASRTSSSTISSFSDLSELANGSNNVVSVAATANNAVDLNLEEPTFDLNRKSLDYRTVYALAQEYAKSTSSPSTLVLPSLSSSQATNSSKKTNLINKRNSSGFARWIKTRIKSYQDPIDRSYHLRK